MTTRSDSRTLFINTSRAMAIIHHHKRAGPCGSGLLVSLNPSQLVRDGMAAAAEKFARDIELANLDEAEANALVANALESAPVSNWWKITITASPPAEMAADDIFIWPENTFT